MEQKGKELWKMATKGKRLRDGRIGKKNLWEPVAKDKKCDAPKSISVYSILINISCFYHIMHNCSELSCYAAPLLTKATVIQLYYNILKY